MSALPPKADIRDVFRRDLLNRIFNESESRFGAARAILPLFYFGLELVDPFFGGSMRTPHFLWRKFEYLLYATTRLRILLPRGGVFEVGNQLLKKCHLAAQDKGIVPAHYSINADQCPNNADQCPKFPP
jgi:hypothetical protein